MFTVVVAQQVHISSIFDRYALFLSPFCDDRKVAFCAWNPEGKALDDAVPDLVKTVGDHRKWRLVIVQDNTDKDTSSKKNPFDYVEFDPSLRAVPEEVGNREEEAAIIEYATGAPGRKNGEALSHGKPNAAPVAPKEGKAKSLLEMEQQLTIEQKTLVQERRRKAVNDTWEMLIEGRKRQYEKALDNPLVQLVTRVLHGPFVSNNLKADVLDDPAYRAYVEGFNYKEKLREEMIGAEVINLPEPEEVLCIAMRNEKLDERAIDGIWSKHDESDYSRFYDRNLYFEKMRYFVYDIIPNTERRYAYEYVRFLYVLLILAGHELPRGAIRPNRVYRLQCLNDNEALRDLVRRYDYKLETTQEKLTRDIETIHNRPPVVLTQAEADQVIHVNTQVIAELDHDLRDEELEVDDRIIGLAADYPQSESKSFQEEYKRVRDNLSGIAASPKRAIRKAVSDFHEAGRRDTSRAAFLSEDEMEELREYAATEEAAIVDCVPEGLSESSRFMLEYGKSREEVDDTLDARMTFRTTLALAGVVAGINAAGYLVPAIQGIMAGREVWPAWCVMGAALAVIVLSAYLAIRYLKSQTRSEITAFNDRTREIDEELAEEVRKYSRYLTHAANFMLANKEIREYENQSHPEERSVLVRQKHMQDIVRRRGELREVFGQFMPEEFMTGKRMVTRDNYNPADAYRYDFDRGTEYTYPVPFAKGHQQQTAFILQGNMIDVPVAFTTSIQAVREELYDE